MQELVIEIGGTGKVSAMHSDKFDLGFLGDKKIRRQTEILFCEDTQLWDIVYIAEDGTHEGSEYLDGFKGYEEAREFEVHWINQCRLNQILSDTHLSLAYAGYLRFADKRGCFTLPDGSCIGEECMHVAPGTPPYFSKSKEGQTNQ